MQADSPPADQQSPNERQVLEALARALEAKAAEPLYTVGVAGFAMSAGAVANGTQAYPEVLEKLRGEDADRDVFTDASSPLPKYVMITMNSPLEAPSLRKKAKGEKKKSGHLGLLVTLLWRGYAAPGLDPGGRREYLACLRQ